MKQRLRWTAAALAVAGGVAGVPVAASAAVTVVADNLNNPRGVTIAPDGSVYVAEAGTAGPRCDGAGQDASCIGASGSVTRVRDGVATRVVRGLLSAGGQDGSFTTGADGVSVTANGSVYIAMSASDCKPLPRAVPAPLRLQAGRLMMLGPRDMLRRVTNVASVECRTNPDGQDRNSNPYAVLALGGGRAIVVDAGANTLVSVKGRRAGTLAVFPLRDGRQFVPTSIALGPDGAYYVGGLDEGAGAGRARVFRVRHGGRPTVYRTGFTNITGLAFGPDGSLYVTQLARRGLQSNQPGGSVVRVAPDGSRTELGVGELFFPAGAAVDASGALYVSNYSVLPGRPAPAGPFRGKRGQLVRVTP
ncbi:ScyD/ScyE family protein [Miltoncostaea marina]|uniref:ScyD/ScyE family protein n=1 Tax=Miltoncostaea marina TaxID=2843215 RepID=UPI001C3D2E52|nr:ScyD/ScyE family protein [Miltoncostaea marina]